MILWRRLTQPVGLAGIAALAAILIAQGGISETEVLQWLPDWLQGSQNWMRLGCALVALEGIVLMLPARSSVRHWNVAYAPRTSRGFRAAIRTIILGLLVIEYGTLGFLVHVTCTAIQNAQLKPVSARMYRMEDLR
ncbi:MAG: hypothetical protein H7Z41_09750 [Cytophagales bacterium]|nr:hypothetical protein [Armatimonadota bacterium]